MQPTSKKQIDEALQTLKVERSNESAWRALFVGTWATGIATAHRVLRGQLDLAKDVTQEAFHRVVRYCDFAKIADCDAFLAYLRTTCVNVSNDALRQLMSHSAEMPLEVESLVETTNNPEALIATAELKRELLDQLNEQDRRLMELLVAGYPLQEIASQMNVSYSNAGVRLYRLRQFLAKYMERKGL
jgi:RNA polymerase sigma factor (sigma-70 family)